MKNYKTIFLKTKKYISKLSQKKVNIIDKYIHKKLIKFFFSFTQILMKINVVKNVFIKY